MDNNQDKFEFVIEIIRLILFVAGIAMIAFLLYQARCYDNKDFEKVVFEIHNNGRILEPISIALVGQFFLRR